MRAPALRLHDDRGPVAAAAALPTRGHWQIDTLQGRFKIAMERFPRR